MWKETENRSNFEKKKDRGGNNKTPEREKKKVVKKGENKNSGNSMRSSTIGRSKSASNINSIKLIDSMYKKNFKSKLF